MSIVGCALIGDWQAIPFDKCTYFSPYHNPALRTNQTLESLLHADTQLKIQKLSDNSRDYNIFASTFGDRIRCSITSGQKDCDRTYNECLLIQFSSGIEFNVYNYPCETINNDNRVKTYACQWKWNQTFCLHINETNNQDSTESFAASAHFIMTKHNYKDTIIKQCTQADVKGGNCHWTPNSAITNHYCTDCPPICRSVSKSLNFAQFCIGAAMLMLSIPVAWVPVASMASERTTKDMQVRFSHQDQGVDI